MLLVVVAITSLVFAVPQEEILINLDSETTYQTISGWETLFPYEIDIRDLTGELLDQLVELGINRVRLEIRAGVENDTDYWALY